MIVFDGEKWVIPKYKITRAVVIYDDRPELYPDGIAEEVLLTDAQKARLEEIQFAELSQSEVEAYVIDGIGTIPDTRSDVDKLIDLIPPENINEDVVAMAEEWQPNRKYPKDKYVKYRGVMYKVLQAHRAQPDWTPDKSPSLFAPLLTSPTGEVLEWVQPESTNPYMKGDRVIYNGKVYESIIDNNVWSPDGYPAGWKLVP